jgi:hypothetical protein
VNSVRVLAWFGWSEKRGATFRGRAAELRVFLTPIKGFDAGEGEVGKALAVVYQVMDTLFSSHVSQC